ncbi:hypothetical protein [Ruminococcus sp. HUN007]|uniref:hypothetical protein n=1 Tax=Ruminococcus sp. HUN007 TaxID=1514668 RepID=UPI0005D29719|nr:hypothetical protein [Ruminococcus sp. HUN007]
MKTVILKVALIAALGALIPTSLAFSVNAQTTETTGVTEDIVSVTENEGGTETAVSGTGDDETSVDVEKCYVTNDDSEDDTVNTGLSFVIGFDDDMDIDNCQTLASEDVDALAKEKLTEEEYARWQELSSQIEASGGGEISDDLINEMTELMIKFTDSDAKWHGCCYTVNADESSQDFDGSITVSDEN